MFALLVLVPLLSQLASAVPSYNGAPVFIGCASTTYPSQSDPNTLALYDSGSIADSNACSNACWADGYLYSSLQGYTSCYCTNVAPAHNDYSDGGATGCTGNTIQITKTTFSNFLGSYDGWATQPGISATSTVDTIEQCFQNCQAYTQAAVSQTATGFDCFCAATQFSFTGANWQPWETNGSSIQFWSHPIGSQVGQSGWVRRQLRERLEMERSQKAMAVCPDSLTACIVPGAEQSFECIDPQSELESCGGCINGYFNGNSNSTEAVDCSALPGVALGGVTCASGQCVVSKCAYGWALTDEGTCE
ncbi:hypothetical protein JCM24511_07675 [Saitozyma sp. JCM 24511]|nr:hypothetical protein JCM24511_07675 [Saitozyma sp. JCM 24511]